MPQAIYILFGALFTVATAIAIGRTLLRRSGAPVSAQEENLLGFVLGSGILSLLVFLLAASHLLHKGVLLALGAAVLLVAFQFGGTPSRRQLPALPSEWRWIFTVGFGVFSVLYFFNAMAPECSPDGTSYHLSFVAQYVREHGLVRIPDNLYAQLTQGIEMLFVFAFAFGKHSAAALVHYAFLVALALLILNYGRRVNQPAAGVTAALLVYASPVAGMDGTSAYIDVALACIVFAVFYLLQLWDENRSTLLVAIIGLTAGFAYATKYTAFIAVPYACGFVWWRARKVRPALVAAACSLVLIVPWVIKNAVWTGNPFSPLMNSVFPNPTVHISFERYWSAHLRTYDLPTRWLIPWELFIHGEKLSGLVGPVFLLLPLALFALRTSTGRRLMVPAILFTLPYFANIGARFTLPALPFWSIALALALSSYPQILAAIALFHCLLSWPSMIRRYSSPYVWALDRIPFKQALRIENEESWLTRKHPDYVVARVIEARTPAHARILAFDGRAESYTTRYIAVAFQSAGGEVLSDIFNAAFTPDFQPAYIQNFRFAQLRARKVRVIQTASARAEEDWAITELRVLSQGHELPRAPEWRLTARPNPWDIQMAFDNSPVTRWKTWEPIRPGMYVEIDFGATQTVDEIRIETSTSQSAVSLRLEAMDEQGTWAPVNAQFSFSELPPLGFFGKAAMAEIKARGYDYLLLEVPEWGAAEVTEAPGAWGLTEVGHAGNARIYRIDVPGPVLAEQN